MQADFIYGHPLTELDPRIYNSDYDVALCETSPSIFFQTPVVHFFVKEHVDTVIITGCITSGCVLASTANSFQWSFRTIVPEDCGDHEEGPPSRKSARRGPPVYADISSADAVMAYFEETRSRNS